jgi:hypothetical protein
MSKLQPATDSPQAAPPVGSGKRSRRLLVLWSVALGLLVIVGVLVALALGARGEARREAKSRACVSCMRSIGLVAHMWADDHDEVMPSSLAEMCKEGYLDKPRLLICPGDRSREPARDRFSVTPDNSSYEIVTPGLRTDAHRDTIFLRCKVHGHVGYVDASVFDGKRRGGKYGRGE